LLPISAPKPTTPQKLAAPVEENPFDLDVAARKAAGEAAEVDPLTRFAIDRRNAFYTRTMLGSGVAALYKNVADDPTQDDATRKKAQVLYDGVRNDIARYKIMRGYDGGLEAAVAFAGHLAGAATSPESLIVSIPGIGIGASVAGLTQRCRCFR
jgi:hypothetical protein